MGFNMSKVTHRPTILFPSTASLVYWAKHNGNYEIRDKWSLSLSLSLSLSENRRDDLEEFVGLRQLYWILGLLSRVKKTSGSVTFPKCVGLTLCQRVSERVGDKRREKRRAFNMQGETVSRSAAASSNLCDSAAPRRVRPFAFRPLFLHNERWDNDDDEDEDDDDAGPFHPLALLFSIAHSLSPPSLSFSLSPLSLSLSLSLPFSLSGRR